MCVIDKPQRRRCVGWIQEIDIGRGMVWVRKGRW